MRNETKWTLRQNDVIEEMKIFTAKMKCCVYERRFFQTALTSRNVIELSHYFL